MNRGLLLSLKESKQRNFVRNCVSPLCFKRQVPGLSLFVFPKPSPWGEGAPVRTLGRMRGQISDWARCTQGSISPLRRRVTFPTVEKSPKGRSGGGVFRLPPPPENLYPTATNQGDLGPPIGCTPWGKQYPEVLLSPMGKTLCIRRESF